MTRITVRALLRLFPKADREAFRGAEWSRPEFKALVTRMVRVLSPPHYALLISRFRMRPA